MKSISTEVKLQDPYEFITGLVPAGFKPDYEPSLYNSEAHLKLQSSHNWHSFHIIRRDKKKIFSSIHFCIEKGIAYSPKSAPFGSFEISDTILASQLFEFMEFYEKELRKRRVKRIVIKTFPEGYHVRQFNMLSVLFFNHNYYVSNAELGALLNIDDMPLIDKIDQWEKRKLKQAQKTKLGFKVIPNKQLKEVFQFIKGCREERGFALSMSFEKLNETVSRLSDSFFCFGVYHNHRMIAASISIRESKINLYNFYSAHSSESDALSPVVFLISEIYAWCKLKNIQLLDLGTSAANGKPNFSLIDFKLRLGAMPSMKLTFEKELK